MKTALVAAKQLIYMQEQLPLPPAGAARVRDGLIAFLRQPAGTPIELVVPSDVRNAMKSAARRGRKHRWMLEAMRAASVILATFGIVQSLVLEHMIFGTAMLIAGGVSFACPSGISPERK